MFGACSVANLTRCLDSVCAINIGANPAARCQYCGSATAGKPTTAGVMKNITAGTAGKHTISDKELKKAPSDPGQRYIWATEQCLNKVSGCTTENVSDTYDTLIEQSCKAAGISTNMVTLITKANKKKTLNSCASEINICMTKEEHCMANYNNCESNSDLDKYFSKCAIEYVSGCEEFLSDIRPSLIASRDDAIKKKQEIMLNTVKRRQYNRQSEKNRKFEDCANNKAKQECIDTVCSGLLTSCDSDKSRKAAEQLCLFYDTACSRLHMFKDVRVPTEIMKPKL